MNEAGLTHGGSTGTSSRGMTAVVDQNLDMPELRDRCLDDGQGALRQGHVCGGRDRAPSGLLDNRAGRLETLRTATRQYEVCPPLRPQSPDADSGWRAVTRPTASARITSPISTGGI